MTSPARSDEVDLKLPEAVEVKLASGLRALLIDIPDCPALRFDLSFRAGHYHCPPDKPELAHLLEHLVLGANPEYASSSDFSRAIEARGGISNAYTDTHNLGYWFDAPHFDWQRMLDLMFLSVGQPLLLPEEFDSELKVVRQELMQFASDRSRRLGNLLANRIGFAVVRYPDRIERLEQISLDDARDYYRRTHSLGNCRILIAGHLPSTRRNWFKRRLEQLELPGELASRPPLPPEKLKPAGIVYLDDAQVEAVYYALIFVNSRRALTQLERDTLSVLRVLLVGGLHSRQLSQVRRRGLTYSLGSSGGSTETSAHYSWSGQVSLDNLEPLLDFLLEDTGRLLAGDLAEAEIDRVKTEMVGDFCRSHITPGAWVDYYEDKYLEADLVVQLDLARRLAAVTRDGILRVINHVLAPNHWTLGLLGRVPAKTRSRLETRLNQPKAVKQAAGQDPVK